MKYYALFLLICITACTPDVSTNKEGKTCFPLSHYVIGELCLHLPPISSRWYVDTVTCPFYFKNGWSDSIHSVYIRLYEFEDRYRNNDSLTLSLFCTNLPKDGENYIDYWFSPDVKAYYYPDDEFYMSGYKRFSDTLLLSFAFRDNSSLPTEEKLALTKHYVNSIEVTVSQ